MKLSLLIAGLLVIGGCASILEPLRGEYSDLEPDAAIGSSAEVRWGGRIVEVLTAPDATCIEILGMPLDVRARPFNLDHDIGRFRACKAGFLDPAIFVVGREITVTGSVDGDEVRQLGEYSYRMPRVRVAQIMLWPERPQIERIHVHHDPFFWGHGWWPVAPVIIYSRGVRK